MTACLALGIAIAGSVVNGLQGRDIQNLQAMGTLHHGHEELSTDEVLAESDRVICRANDVIADTCMRLLNECEERLGKE